MTRRGFLGSCAGLVASVPVVSAIWAALGNGGKLAPMVTPGLTDCEVWWTGEAVPIEALMLPDPEEAYERFAAQCRMAAASIGEPERGNESRAHRGGKYAR